MLRLRSWFVPAGAACVALMLAGCDKKVQLVFDNVMARSVDVSLSAPSIGEERLGSVGPHSRLSYKLKINKDMLPAECSWRAGGMGGDFTITEKTADKLYIAIDDKFGPSGPRDKNTEVQQRRTEEGPPVVIEEHEKVE